MDYQKQAKDFCVKTETTIDVKFLYSGLYFDEDKENRDIYEIKIIRFKNGKALNPYIFKFGQSRLYSRDYVENAAQQRRDRGEPAASIVKYEKPAVKAPTEYDILAGLTKYDPETFSDFCANYGYDEDSRKAEKIYFEVQKEWSKVNYLFSDFLEELQEIQ